VGFAAVDFLIGLAGRTDLAFEFLDEPEAEASLFSASSVAYGATEALAGELPILICDFRCCHRLRPFAGGHAATGPDRQRRDANNVVALSGGQGRPAKGSVSTESCVVARVISWVCFDRDRFARDLVHLGR
jgi:hypothetical protein